MEDAGACVLGISLRLGSSRSEETYHEYIKMKISLGRSSPSVKITE